MPPADEAALRWLRWLRWWCIDSWLSADASWRQAGFYQLDDTRLAALARTHHPLIVQELQLSQPVSPPDLELLAWLDLSDAQRLLALRLAAEVCWRDSTQTMLLPEQQRWCRRIAQAMRPGLWLTGAEGLAVNDGDINALWLLRLRAGPVCWSRLRLAFPTGQVHIVESFQQPDAFPPRLLPLWQAVLWYASQEPRC
ncbi:type III secretion system protein [Pantoea agglomerans]|nr:type III secretion system protein [Pantoea agglomerans]PEI06348.1 type III secretion system protein [Pantoea agglomerans]